MKWITFQILTALSRTHSKSIYHGDIKTENVLLTSWNWVFLADFSSFKPVYLPDDNPTNFSMFFDSSSRRSCYIAPERFVSSSERLFGKDDVVSLTFEMDIFSTGYQSSLNASCTIAEMFLEGRPLFTLSQLLKYRKGEYDPLVALARIEDETIRQMIATMISINPSERLNAKTYLEKYRTTIFPIHFYDFAHSFAESLANADKFSRNTKYRVKTSDGIKVADADARIEHMYSEFHVIAANSNVKMTHSTSATNETFPVFLEIPNFSGFCTDIVVDDNLNDLALVYTSMITAFLQNCLYPSSKLNALEMLLAIGIQLPDEFKIDRIIPFVVLLLSDSSVVIRAKSLLVLTQMVAVA